MEKLKWNFLKKFWINKFVCLRSKMYAIKSVYDKKIKLKGIFESCSKKLNLMNKRIFRWKRLSKST